MERNLLEGFVLLVMLANVLVCVLILQNRLLFFGQSVRYFKWGMITEIALLAGLFFGNRESLSGSMYSMVILMACLWIGLLVYFRIRKNELMSKDLSFSICCIGNSVLWGKVIIQGKEYDAIVVNYPTHCRSDLVKLDGSVEPVCREKKIDYFAASSFRARLERFPQTAQNIRIKLIL